jgi:GTP-binding protein
VLPLADTRYLLSETDPSLLDAALAEVAFVGRSNSGKSSMLNAICRQKNLARVSQTPGRTRTINVYAAANLRWLVDLPGYGYASGPASSREGWMAMIEKYLTGRPSLRCVFLLVDAKVGPTALDLQMGHWLATHNLPFRVIANKIDQVKSSKHIAQKQFIGRSLNKPISEVAWVSATEGTGIPPLRADVIKLLELSR